MSNKPETPSQKAEADQRAKRRSEQLRANLMRRKAQIRSRRSGAEDERGEGLPVADAGHNSGQSPAGMSGHKNETD
ncbi:hypothetical protein P8H26_14830 [Pseudochrobactrum sp. sp1633]|uniref:hypothetical protein n=1 Tax=Pseudochrobactrum sp. sp1633 TaxID=3036706 RepID=UPI0025A68D20|nr:hypothetical protein [Pseudochrobactrum sp. sp1633]MDM8346666.1 hypothetical protein [Pseudochrobactrum sp. sp1633]HWD13956.1 hypothetical protein [Pseudochrobactrum sp.]